MRRWPRGAGPAQRPHASLPHQSGAGGSSHRGRLAVRSSPRHHHVPRPLEQKPVLNSNTTDRSQGKRGPRRGPRRGSRRPGHTHGGSQGVARPVQGREDGGPERSSAHSAPALEATPCDSTPVPFTSLGLDARLLEGVRDLGFVETRPIQSAVIPFALAGHDLIACAETGTGKTAAFVVPTLQWLVNAGAPLKACARDARETTMDARGSTAEAVAQSFSAAKSRVLVLAPTRELAVQIEDEIHGLAYHTTVTSAAVYGGVEMGAQERALKAGVDIIVATPGRLMDHMRQQNADLSAIELLVLDEADRMMDMGFWPDVRRIITALPSSAAGRQTLLFSATMPGEVVRDALEITREAKYVQIGVRSAPAKSITHRAENVAASQKVH